jgi:hypothetical protein
VIAFFDGERENLAFVVAFAASNGDNLALGRFVFSAVRYNDAASGGAYFFYSADQNAVVEWGEFRRNDFRF